VFLDHKTSAFCAPERGTVKNKKKKKSNLKKKKSKLLAFNLLCCIASHQLGDFKSCFKSILGTLD